MAAAFRLLLAAIVLALPASAIAQQKPQTAKGQSKPIYTESTVEEMRVDTPDGSIYGWVRRPVVPDGVKVPIILTYSPYHLLESQRPGDEGTEAGVVSTGDLETTPYFVARGYARAWFHLVGTGRSGGCYDYGGPRERRTAAAVIEHLAAQPWSNARVGMLGVSYDGTTQWAAAVEAPPHLVTIVPQAAIGRWWDYAYGQGVRFASGSGTPLIFDYGFDQGFVPGVPPDAGDADAILGTVTPCEREEHQIRGFGPDPVYDDFWDERDYLARIAKVRASVMIEGSWVDYNVHPINSIEMWEALPARVERRLAMAQQGHGPFNTKDGLDLRHAWFDHFLLGLDTGILRIPAADSVVGSPKGELRFQSDAWPPRGTKTSKLTIGGVSDPGLRLTGDATEPLWRDAAPALSEADVLAESGQPGVSLVFVSDVLAAPMRIAGTPALDATIRTDAASTYLTPVLFEEDAGGNRSVITRGLLNSRNRDSLRTSTALTSDEWHAVVRFQPVDHVIEKGNRLGVALMSMNSNEALYGDETAASNELVMDAKPRLDLPVVGEPQAVPPALPGVPAMPALPPIVPAPGLSARITRRGTTLLVRGRAPAGARVEVRLRRGKRTVAMRLVRAGANGRYTARFRRAPRGVRALVTTVLPGGRRLTART